MMDSVFDGQVALFTASTSGIALASAELCARYGARVIVLNGRNAEAGARAVERIRAVARPGTTVEFIAADLCDGSAAGSVCEEVLRRHGRIDVFIHGGGGDISPRLFVDI